MWSTAPWAARTGGVRSLLLTSLRGYQRSWLLGDVVAALTLFTIAVPEQLATARLAGMPPITGWYAFVAGSVIFALLGSNPQMSVGADSTIAPLFAVGIATVVARTSLDYAALVAILAVAVGVLIIVVALLRFGWIAEFLSTPIITGFLGGVATIIVVHQLPDLLGLPHASGSTLHRAELVARNAHLFNGWSLSIGIGVLVVVLVADRIDRRVPGALIGLIGSTVLSVALDLPSHQVMVLGALAHDAPRVGLHEMPWSAVVSVAPVAGVVALVIVSQTAATTRAFTGERNGDVDVNRDFFGVGAANVVAGLVGSFPVNASPPRTAAVATASGRSQLAGLVAAGAVVAVIPAASLLAHLPVATLAAILVFVAAKILHVGDLIHIARYNRFEFALALITLLTVALVGVEQGIAVAVGLAIIDRARLSARPRLRILGRIPATTSWVPLGGIDQAEEVPAVVVVSFATALWYANAAHFRTEMTAAIDRAGGSTRFVVLDCIGMTDIDYTGSCALRQLLDYMDGRGLSLALARTNGAVGVGLARSGLLARIGTDHVFASVDGAVRALVLEPPQHHSDPAGAAEDRPLGR